MTGACRAGERSGAEQQAPRHSPRQDVSAPAGSVQGEGGSKEQRLTCIHQSCWHADAKQRPSFQDMLSQNVFDNVVIDSCISESNTLARLFWRERFLGVVSGQDDSAHIDTCLQYKVPWREFQKQFSSFLKIPAKILPLDDLRYEALKFVCSNESWLQLTLAEMEENRYTGDEEISIDDFGNALEWFGPLESGVEFLEKVALGCLAWDSPCSARSPSCWTSDISGGSWTRTRRISNWQRHPKVGICCASQAASLAASLSVMSPKKGTFLTAAFTTRYPVLPCSLSGGFQIHVDDAQSTLRIRHAV